MHNFREVVLKAARNARESGEITNRQFSMIWRRSRNKRVLAEVMDCCTDEAMAAGLVQPGISLDTIDWEKLFAFIEKIIKLIVSLFSPSSGDEMASADLGLDG